MSFNRRSCLLALSLLLAACAPSQYQMDKVDRLVEGHRETALNCEDQAGSRCAGPSPVLDMGRESLQLGRHHVTLIEYGEDSLLLRLHLVRAATTSVDVQNFILRRDHTGELFLNELLEAARRGVKVRLMLDQMFSLTDLEYLVGLVLAHQNLEIRFYNPTFHKAKMSKGDWLNAVACCFRRFNQRMHNKLMVVDGLVGVTGGRNIADRYFDYDTNYEFKDRDVMVVGPSVPEMVESFGWFWDYEKSVPVQYLRDVSKELLDQGLGVAEVPPYDLPPRLLPLLEEVEDLERIADLFIVPSFEVVRMEYFSDRPRKQDFPEGSDKQDITRELYDVLLSARESIIIQSPYLVLSKRARGIFSDIKENYPDIELVFSTNSLASTDADNVYANTHRHKDRYVDEIGFLMYEFKPFPVDAPLFFRRWPALLEEKSQGIGHGSTVSGDNSTIPMPAPRIGLHSKTFVVDSRVTMIGSHNFDPRSEGFNTENGLIIYDKSFAQAVETLIRRDIEPQNSWVVAMRPDKEQEKTAIRTPPGEYEELAWFKGPTSVYELAPGKEEVPPSHPDFYANYYDLGSFPQVVRTRRQVTVVFLGSFFFFLEPIL